MEELDIFSRALDIADPDERHQFLTQACNCDSALILRIESLLEMVAKNDSFLEQAPLAAVLNASLDANSSLEIGPYKLLEQIGEGGMGTVWLAEQQHPVRRRVALKLIKPGMASNLFSVPTL